VVYELEQHFVLFDQDSEENDILQIGMRLGPLPSAEKTKVAGNCSVSGKPSRAPVHGNKQNYLHPSR